ncbi:MAG: ATP-binding cassette domain-containing protein [Myxococcales bacterium]|nr:ATP-binding cassette domain-containing protein [Myxococcales bacterium]
MSFTALLAEHVDIRRLAFTTVAGGVFAALAVTAVNEASAAGVELGSWWRAGLFFLILAGMYAARRASSRVLIRDFEAASADLRGRFAASLRGAPLRAIEELGDRIERATGDLSLLSTTLDSWVSGVQHLAFTFAMTFAIGLISMKALALWIFVLGWISVHLATRLRAIRAELSDIGDTSARLGAQVSELADGFVQAKLDGRLAASITADIAATAEQLYAHQNAVEELDSRAFHASFVLMFLFGSGVAAFSFEPASGYEMVIFFELAWAPLFGVLAAFPEILRAEAAATRVLRVLEELPPEPGPGEGPVEPFEVLELRAVEFSYADHLRQSEFAVGPLDLTIRRGELVFVTGGNGSGKTTMLKLLLGLYAPSRGSVVLDGQCVRAGARQALRDRCTVIMSRAHVFDRLYGLEDVDSEEVRALLSELGIADAVPYRDGGFAELRLSTGQLMRLAMVVALLERRPLCVFDEWTANQDPEMTRWYYEVLLPRLREAGTTVIAVSHDERYFSCADTLVRMEAGKIAAEPPR